MSCMQHDLIITTTVVLLEGPRERAEPVYEGKARGPSRWTKPQLCTQIHYTEYRNNIVCNFFFLIYLTTELSTATSSTSCSNFHAFHPLQSSVSISQTCFRDIVESGSSSTPAFFHLLQVESMAGVVWCGLIISQLDLRSTM